MHSSPEGTTNPFPARTGAEGTKGTLLFYGSPGRRRVALKGLPFAAPLAVSAALPILPLALRGGPTLPIDLETTYAEARRRSRL